MKVTVTELGKKCGALGQIPCPANHPTPKNSWLAFCVILKYAIFEYESDLECFCFDAVLSAARQVPPVSIRLVLWTGSLLANSLPFSI